MGGEQNDLELLQAWAMGDNRAGGRLIKRHFPALVRFFGNKVPESEQADLIQSTMLECVRSKDKFRGQAQFRTYLLSIARNVLLHYYRQRSRKQDRLDPLADSVAALSTAGLFSKLAKEGDREMILMGLRQLPIDLQIALELTYWERLTANECAIILGIPANTVSGRIRRGKQALGKIIDEMSQRPASARPASSDVDQWMNDVRDHLGGDPRDLLEGRDKGDDDKGDDDDKDDR